MVVFLSSFFLLLSFFFFILYMNVLHSVNFFSASCFASALLSVVYYCRVVTFSSLCYAFILLLFVHTSFHFILLRRRARSLSLSLYVSLSAKTEKKWNKPNDSNNNRPTEWKREKKRNEIKLTHHQSQNITLWVRE